MSVKEKQNEFISSLDEGLRESFNSHIKKIMSQYDAEDGVLFKLKPLCPVCGGRQKLPAPYSVECPCREAFSRVLYFKTLLNHTRDEHALPPVGLYNLPRVVLFRSDLRSESQKTFLFYWAVKCNLYHRKQLRKKIHRRNFEDIVNFEMTRGEDKPVFHEYLSYIFLDSVRLLSDMQESFLDGVLTSFIESRYVAGKSVWLYQSLDSDFKFTQAYDKIAALGKIIVWGEPNPSVKNTLLNSNTSSAQPSYTDNNPAIAKKLLS